MSGVMFQRAYALEDISIRAGGDGRTVEAYAAVWDTPVEIHDREGHYREQISRSAFDKTIRDRGDKPWPVIFNHGMTLYGTPSERGTVPIGASIERPRVETRGLVTVSRYHAGESADEVLEGIRSGAINSQSFSGKFIQSSSKAPRGGYRADRNGDLPLVTRTEIAMREYGPAVFAAYPTAAITGVRASLPPDQLALLQILLPQLAAADAALDPIVDALCATDGALDAAQAVVADILGQPDPDPGEMDDEDAPMAMNAEHLDLTSLARRLDAAFAARASGTPTGAATDEPPSGHSGRLSRAEARARLYKLGVLTP